MKFHLSISRATISGKAMGISPELPLQRVLLEAAINILQDFQVNNGDHHLALGLAFGLLPAWRICLLILSLEFDFGRFSDLLAMHPVK